ncbi:hypothetical protein NITLEN_10122 [Nitrospira lenta]|uniref:Uncharacterized protein n=1 Tax=Nitrospira lenta TaxID=1436998 RepID=A0A330L7X2_9BACT|nr:hypothetical protein NITLEN_10122 [Nitrospira lenta]
MSSSSQPYELQQIAQHGGILSHLLRPVTRFANLRARTNAQPEPAVIDSAARTRALRP